MAHTMTLMADADRTAQFGAFVAQHSARARSVAWRLCDGNATLADEVAQEAFVAAWEALPGFREEAQLGTWFYRILVRTASRKRRWNGVRDRFRSWFRPEAQAPPPTGDPALRRRIAAAMGRLSDAQRQTFVLVHLEGFTIAETAVITERAAGTIKSHLHRALTTLRAELADVKEER